MMKLTLPLPPSANRYWRHFRGVVVVSPEARRYRHEAALLAVAAGARPLSGAVVLRADVYRLRRCGDLDNYIKVLCDALQGIAYGSDAQIVELHARRFDDKLRPRVEVSIEAASLKAVTANDSG